MLLSSAGFTSAPLSARRTQSVLYGQCLARAGGVCAVYAGGDPARFAAVCEGLLLTGGPDVAPARYGAAPLPSDEVDEDRDREEFALIDAFLAVNKPIFGICRGIQVLNVYFGGTLRQQVDGHGDGAVHRVTTAPGCRLRALCGETFLTNSFHHQAVGTLAPGFRTAAVADDGTVEAIEHLTLPVRGVQWHPERMVRGVCADTETDQLSLFKEFLRECRQSKPLVN